MESATSPTGAVERELTAVIFYLTAFAHIDGTYDPREREYLQTFLARLVSYRSRLAGREAGVSDRAEQDALTAKWQTHFDGVFAETERTVAGYFSESVPEGEDPQEFVYGRLKLRCFELFRTFNGENQARLLVLADELIAADGQVHPREAQFRQELEALLHQRTDETASTTTADDTGTIEVDDPMIMPSPDVDDPFFVRLEVPVMFHPDSIKTHFTEDLARIERTTEQLARMRASGSGKLAGARVVSDLQTRGMFLDGTVLSQPIEPGRPHEVLVLGDLHGCYSCMKAAFAQTGFLEKLEAQERDRSRGPVCKVVFLGDYVDRGRYGYEGVLRGAMELFLRFPKDVFLLRGNHEWYLEISSKILSGVKPAEAIDQLLRAKGEDIARSYKSLFDVLPTCLLFGPILFAHAGIPRADTIGEKWKDLSSLNDPEVRFQMLWSDPSDADVVPLDLQRANARFAFGRHQFRGFMERLGCRAMIRGHDRVLEGFKQVYDDPRARLFTLFSAGGRGNKDLPATSNYRQVTPMALLLHHRDNQTRLEPFILDWAQFNRPEFNGFARSIE